MKIPNFDKDQRRVLQLLRRTGPLSRSALAAELETSPAALTRLSRGLIDIGLVEELPESESHGRGRPAVPLRLAAGGGYAVGATAHKGLLDIALVDFTGTTIAIHHEAIDAITPKVFARKVRALTHRMVERHDLLGRRMLGIGIAVPGPSLSAAGDRWSVVDVLPDWRDVPLRDLFLDEFDWPLWIENDANAAAIAEFYLGGLVREFSTVVVLLLGFGIGAGVIVDGRLVRGQFGVAGEIGCLFPGHLPRPSPLDLLAMLRADGCHLTSVTDIDADAADQAPTIAAWLDRAAEQLRTVCNTAFVWLDPGAIVLAGTLPPAILEGLADRLHRAELVTTVLDRRPPLRVSALRGSPITLGAALLPIHALAAPG
ncbi:ROK family transcriptional regulator [Sphingomonas sanxanigenens]|uniref:ROK family transcriptional regulator n=1 Tax=Sphingomonas sanxanigenens DSM 19645 = NX02 TaxID=1123269 RepID=W0AFR1_9SPHN|nr:ROK family transcriptional regulator [Sphingomonas sanxanigenens]AHE55113.1 ROK family transcriptional regulator [Sphingomonas sanxanigenens DSM 19645 = NX02]